MERWRRKNACARSSNLYPCLTDANVFEDYYGYHRRRNDYLSTDRLIYTSMSRFLKPMMPFRR